MARGRRLSLTLAAVAIAWLAQAPAMASGVSMAAAGPAAATAREAAAASNSPKAAPPAPAKAAPPLDAAALQLQLNVDAAKLDLEGRRTEQALSTEAYRQQLEFNRKLYWHKVIAYYLQLFLTLVLTGVGIGILFMALRLSFLQFKRDEQREPGDVASVKWTAAGFEMTSSVIGLFVLVAAMAFFWVYIKEVYKLTDPNAGPSASSPAAEAPVKPAVADGANREAAAAPAK